LVERIFHVKENQTTVRRELLAGLTTFMTMAYVVVVNPQILSEIARAEQHSRGGRQRHTGFPQARNSRRHRLVYRVYRLAQRKDDRR